MVATAAIGIAMVMAIYGNPFLLLSIWVCRLKMKQVPDFRFRLGWISLALATVGCVAFWVGMGSHPEAATQMFDQWFRRWFIACSFISGVAFLTGIIGKGKMQWAVVVSATLTPLACVLSRALE
jgi:hypothetical protein